jgi:hypothetical protein
VPQDNTPPYRFGIDDQGDAPLGADNAMPAADNTEGQSPADPARSEGEYRKAVLTLLTEIRDAILEEQAG